MKKSPRWPITLLFGLFTLLNIADIVTALLGNSKYEANPVFLASGSWLITCIPKISIMLIVAFFWWRERYTSRFSYFAIIIAMVYGSLVVSLGVASNIYSYHIEHDPAHQTELATLSPPDAMTASSFYWGIMTVVYMIPVVLGLVAFYIYDKTVGRIIITRKTRWRDTVGWLKKNCLNKPKH